MRTNLVRFGIGSLAVAGAVWVGQQIAIGFRKRLQWEADRARFRNERIALGGRTSQELISQANGEMLGNGADPEALYDIRRRMAAGENPQAIAAEIARDVTLAGGSVRSNLVVLVRKKGSDGSDWKEFRTVPDPNGTEFQA